MCCIFSKDEKVPERDEKQKCFINDYPMSNINGLPVYHWYLLLFFSFCSGKETLGVAKAYSIDLMSKW